MSGKSAFLDPAVESYILETTVHIDPVFRDLQAETAKQPHPEMAIGPAQAQFMQVMARAIGARRYLEVGVFTGSSTLAMALALPADGAIVACDIDAAMPAIGQRYWRRAGVSEKIDLRIGPARETLAALVAASTEPFDIAFIDADKTGYDAYYESCLQLLRPAGLLIVDNALWSGDVANPSVTDESTQALRALNAKAAHDPRVDATLIPVGDGLLIAWKH